MTSFCTNYHSPVSVEEAIELLRHYDGDARVVGGGTDLLVEMRRGLRRPVMAMIDATRIADCKIISRSDDCVLIGCGVTHTEIINNATIKKFGTCLAEGCGVIGGPQVRNVGTLAGNVAHALPAGDGTMGFLALAGEIEIAGVNGVRWIPARDSFAGPGRSVIDRHREILTRLRFRAAVIGEGSAFHRVMRPQGLCLPIISMAVSLRLDGASISAATISMGPVGPTPHIADAAMKSLVGDPPSAEKFSEAAEIALQNVTLRGSKYRATTEYRAQMIRTYLPLILARAAERAAASRHLAEGVAS